MSNRTTMGVWLTIAVAAVLITAIICVTIDGVEHTRADRDVKIAQIDAATPDPIERER